MTLQAQLDEWADDEKTVVDCFASVSGRDDGSHPMHNQFSRTEHLETQAELVAVGGE